MAKKKRPKWQQLGFKTYAEYQKHLKTKSIENATKATVRDMFQECLQEAVNCQIVKERQHLEATDRAKYHQLRLQGLNKLPIVSE